MLEGDDDSRREFPDGGGSIGVALLLGGGGLVLGLAYGVAMVLGLDLNPQNTDNRGLGTPLSVTESAAMLRTQAEKGETAASADAEQPSLEELREEQALLDIIFGMNTRKK